MTNMEKIDHACVETYQRYIEYYHDEAKMNEHLRKALREGLSGNFSNFTRQNGAREQIMMLSKEELEAELLKNLVRTVIYKKNVKDAEYDNGRAILDLNQINDTVSLSAIENGLYAAMMEGNMNASEKGIERGQLGFEWMNNPRVQDAVIASFVHNRYGRNINLCLEDILLSSSEIDLLDSIDAYSLRKQNGYHI